MKIYKNGWVVRTQQDSHTMKYQLVGYHRDHPELLVVWGYVGDPVSWEWEPVEELEAFERSLEKISFEGAEVCRTCWKAEDCVPAYIREDVECPDCGRLISCGK